MSSLAEEVAALSERLAEYEATVADITAELGHAGISPDDLRDAVGQITNRLLLGHDLDAPLTGAAEVVRVMLTYAHVGAWFVQGITRAPIAARVASPELVATLNAGPPSWEALRSLLLLPEGLTEDDARTWLANWFALFDRDGSAVLQ